MRIMDKIALGAGGIVVGSVIGAIGVGIAKNSAEKRLDDNTSLKTRTDELDKRKEELERKIKKLDNVLNGVCFLGIAGFITVGVTVTASDEINRKDRTDCSLNKMSVRIDEVSDISLDAAKQIDNIADYLSSKDSEYWDIIERINENKCEEPYIEQTDDLEY